MKRVQNQNKVCAALFEIEYLLKLSEGFGSVSSINLWLVILTWSV